jgi:hypothetical protein
MLGFDGYNANAIISRNSNAMPIVAELSNTYLQGYLKPTIV